MTDRWSIQPVNHKRKNGTNWISSRKTNTFLSLRVIRQIGLSALQESTRDPKALFVQGSF